MAVLAADHVFEDGKQFARLCAEALGVAAAGEIVTFGITPDHPATGYGYIHPAEALAIDGSVRRIERFVEKPDEKRARAFIEQGYLWNSGNFVFRADVMLDELARFEPEIAAAAVSGGRGGEKGSRLRGPRPCRLRPRAEDLDRLRGDGANAQGGGADGRRRLVGRRRVVGGLAAEPRATPAATAFAGGRSRSIRRTFSYVRRSSWRRLSAFATSSSSQPATRFWSPTDHRRTKSRRWSSGSRPRASPKRPSMCEYTGHGVTIRASTRARATRSSALSCALGDAFRCKSTIIGRSIG